MELLSKKANIIFDLDGTIIDSIGGIQGSFDHAFQTTFDALNNHNIRAHIGPPIKDILVKVMDPAPGTADIDRFVLHYQSHYDEEGFKASTLYEGMRETLLALKNRGKVLFVATNKREAPTIAILELLGIKELFTAIYCIDSAGGPFPNKGEMVKQLLNENQLVPDDTVLVGDTVHDEKAAVANNLAYIFADYGFGTLSDTRAVLIKDPVTLLNYF